MDFIYYTLLINNTISNRNKDFSTFLSLNSLNLLLFILTTKIL